MKKNYQKLSRWESSWVKIKYKLPGNAIGIRNLACKKILASDYYRKIPIDLSGNCDVILGNKLTKIALSNLHELEIYDKKLTIDMKILIKGKTNFLEISLMN